MCEKTNVVRVAAVQVAPIFLNREATVEKAIRIIDEAAAEGAKLIAFPEAFIPGYPWWIWFDEPAAGIPFYTQLYKNAVEIPSEATRAIGEAARNNHVYVSVSVNEKSNGSLFLTQLWFDPSGNLIGKHRKLKPSSAERYIWGDGDASTMPVFDTEIGRLGGLECWENAVPGFIWAMANKNEQIHVQAWPSCFPFEEHLFSNYPLETVAKAYSIQTQCYSVISSQIYTEEMREMMCDTDKKRAIMQPGYGMTMIVDPLGRVISSVPRDEEGICYADLDLDALIAGKFIADIGGHEANPNIRLVVDESPKGPGLTIGKNAEVFFSYDEMAEEADK